MPRRHPCSWMPTGRARRGKLMLHANQQRFLLRVRPREGKLLLAKPFVKILTWASGIGADGRPIMFPNQEPSEAGTKVCPSQDGATNWFSPSLIPRPACTTSRRSRSAASTRSGRKGRGKAARAIWADRSGRRRIPSRSGSCAPSTSTPARSSGSCRSRDPRILGRHAVDRERVGHLRRGRRRAHCGGRRGRSAALDVPDESDLESLADDVRVRRPAVHSGGGGCQHHRAGRSGVSGQDAP